MKKAQKQKKSQQKKGEFKTAMREDPILGARYDPPPELMLVPDVIGLCKALKSPSSLKSLETKSGLKVEQVVDPIIRQTLRDLLGPRGGRSKGFRYRGKISFVGQIIANSGLGKYLQFYSASTSLLWNSVSTAAEFTTLDVLFDEFFIHSVHIKYEPHNIGSSNTSASGSSSGSPGDLNTCAGMLSCLYHNASTYTDNSSAFSNMASAQAHKMVNLGKSFGWTVRNIEKFDPNGPIGDMTTATSTMGWCQIASAAKYGGTFQISTPVPTAASAATNTILASGVFGDFLMTFDISWRARA